MDIKELIILNFIFGSIGTVILIAIGLFFFILAIKSGDKACMHFFVLVSIPCIYVLIELIVELIKLAKEIKKWG